MRNTRLPALLLAGVLQLLPMLRTAAVVNELGTPLFAILFRWAAFTAVAMGGIDAVSGATSNNQITNTKTYRGTNGVALKKLSLTVAPEQAHFWSVSPLPTGLTLTGTAGGSSWSIGGTPKVSGVFNILLTAKDQQSSGAGSTLTATLVLTIVDGAVVGTAPSITSSPLAQTVNAGQPVSFTVSASGTAPLTCFWSKDGGLVATVSNSTGTDTFSIASASALDAGLYSVVVSNSIGKTAAVSAQLTVNTAPVVTSAPVQQRVNEGQNASFTVAAGGTAPLTYYWSKDGVVVATVSNSTGTDTFSIASTTVLDAGVYSVIVSNSVGKASPVSAGLIVNVAAAFSAPPQSLALYEGEPVRLSVSATGTLPITYQWFFNNQPIADGTNSVLLIPAAHATNAGSYTVTAHNVVLTATSGAGVLTIAPALQISTITPTATGYRVDWSSLASHSYAVETRSAVESGVWVVSGTALAPSGGGATSANVDVAPSGEPQFVRLRVLP